MQVSRTWFIISPAPITSRFEKGKDAPLKGRKGGVRTPTLSSITPHKTSIVEFPFLAIVMICTIRMMEHTVVNAPRRKMTRSPAFLLALICNCKRIGIGRKNIMQSKMMVIAART